MNYIRVTIDQQDYPTGWVKELEETPDGLLKLKVTDAKEQARLFTAGAETLQALELFKKHGWTVGRYENQYEASFFLVD